VNIDKTSAEIVELLDRHFVDPDLLSEWGRTGRRGELLGIAAPREPKRVNEILARLGLSHTRYFTPNDIDYFHLLETYASAGLRGSIQSMFTGGRISYVGIKVISAEYSGQFFIAALAADGVAAKAGLLIGDELISVQDTAYEPVCPFKVLEGIPTRLSYRRRVQGPRMQVELRPEHINPRRMFLSASRAGARLIRSGSRTIGYFKPWSLAGEHYWKALVQTVSNRLSSASSLILDLRRSIGGASPDSAEFFIGRSPQLELRDHKAKVHLVNSRWRQPLVILVDSSVSSGNEVLAFALQRAGVPIIGTPTAGAVAAARPFVLRNGDLLLVTTHRVLVDGEGLEGVGILPNVEVPFELRYAAGEDPQLAAAVETCAQL
jgi:carboxyl-terminal processing protease